MAISITPVQFRDRTLVEIRNLLAANISGIQVLLIAGGNYSGHGSPEGVVAAVPGKMYVDIDSGAIYTKMTGTGNTGWSV